jgi:hypothetical protein
MESGKQPGHPQLPLCLLYELAAHKADEPKGGEKALGRKRKPTSKPHAFMVATEATRSPVLFKPGACLFIKNENKIFF